MTDRFHTLTVVLETDRRDDDAEYLMAAIRQLRGVLSVTGNVADIGSHMAEERAKAVVRQRLYDAAADL